VSGRVVAPLARLLRTIASNVVGRFEVRRSGPSSSPRSSPRSVLCRSRVGPEIDVAW